MACICIFICIFDQEIWAHRSIWTVTTMVIDPVIRTAYLDYLQSSTWRMRRNRALQRADYRCERCDGKDGLQVHHRTYERLGREWDQDLEALCDDCHRGHHLTEAIADGLGVYLKVAYSIKREAAMWESLADLTDAIKERCARLRMPYHDHQVDRVIRLIEGDLRFQGPIPPPSPDVARDRDFARSRPPCRCTDCVAAGVSNLRQHRTPDTNDWMHGDALRRWYAAKDFFKRRARAAVGAMGRHGVGFERLVGGLLTEDDDVNRAIDELQGAA